MPHRLGDETGVTQASYGYRSQEAQPKGQRQKGRVKGGCLKVFEGVFCGRLRRLGKVKKCCDRGGSFIRERVGWCARMEGVRAVVEHSLRVSVGVGGGLDAQVSEHSVRLPATKELDSVRIYAGAEEGSAPSGRSKRALMSRGEMPVVASREAAAIRRALVTSVPSTEYQQRWSQWALKWRWIGVSGSAW